MSNSNTFNSVIRQRLSMVFKEFLVICYFKRHWKVKKTGNLKLKRWNMQVEF